ncbi:MAG TPA: D-alanyl-D-alanine carboxypeptidase/D-alanyl-D-alanine-endopeptidase, partial [Acidimicrobiia bacterium]|nr:D-alanyl-D-alanine carboxypeptidase/D-alanyl-D-alanine-endopeptidase [Acidimicrobiia bacterium]
MSVWQRVTAAVLAIGAAVAVVLAFTGDDGRTAAAAPKVAATPLWSVRRVPQPVVDAVGAQRLQHVLDDNIGGDTTCFLVDGSGALLASHNPDMPLLGASTQKVLVAAAMLSTLGPDFVYETRVTAPAAPQDGAVDHLWLVGGGDPVLATDDYREYLQSQGKTKGDVTTRLETLADSIAAAGVHRVPGGIIADDSRYDDQRAVPTWEPQYQKEGDVGPLGALTVNDGFRSWATSKVPVTDPALYAATELTSLLTARGVQVGAPSRGVSPPNAVEVAKVASPPLRDVLGSMLASSDNSSAELFTKELGYQVSHQGTTAAGTAVILAKLRELGVPTDGVVLQDGSGLDRGDRVTCRTLVAALALGDRPNMRALWDGLPVAGQNGTLFDQLNDTKLAGKMRGKTGSLNGVSGLLGMV